MSLFSLPFLNYYIDLKNGSHFNEIPSKTYHYSPLSDSSPHLRSPRLPFLLRSSLWLLLKL